MDAQVTINGRTLDGEDVAAIRTAVWVQAVSPTVLEVTGSLAAWQDYVCRMVRIAEMLDAEGTTRPS